MIFKIIWVKCMTLYEELLIHVYFVCINPLSCIKYRHFKFLSRKHSVFLIIHYSVVQKPLIFSLSSTYFTLLFIYHLRRINTKLKLYIHMKPQYEHEEMWYGMINRGRIFCYLSLSNVFGLRQYILSNFRSFWIK